MSRTEPSAPKVAAARLKKRALEKLGRPVDEWIVTLAGQPISATSPVGRPSDGAGDEASDATEPPGSWPSFVAAHRTGDVLRGTVTKVVPFGAFVEVVPGVQGLVHVSELSDRHVRLPEDVVSVGDRILVRIVGMDVERRRVDFSVRQVAAGPGSVVEADRPRTVADDRPAQGG